MNEQDRLAPAPRRWQILSSGLSGRHYICRIVEQSDVNAILRGRKGARSD